MRVIPVSYASAEKIAKQLEANVISTRGKVTFNKRTNAIIIRDVMPNIEVAKQLVETLDTPTPQVLIEARIVEARSSFLREVGVQWGGSILASSATGAPTGLMFPFSVGVGGGAVDQVTPTEGLVGAGAANPNFAVNLPATTGTGQGGALGLSLGTLGGIANINLRLSAMEETGQVRIISAPKITTLDNVEAKIEQGTRIPISVVSAQGVNTKFEEATLGLTVTPRVTADGRIRLKVLVQKNEPDFVNTGARGDPTILKKSAKSEMLIPDGDTAVIGGIYTRNTTVSYSKVPWFADIPIIGWLFKKRRESDERSEVLIFITPRIIKQGETGKSGAGR
jgi:type IV pilus assembly protein PilQ